MKKFILCSILVMALSGLVKADAITFEATVNASSISLDEALQLTLTVTGINQDLDPINLPNLDGFSAKYVGPSTSISFVNVNGNAESHSEHSFIYNLFPNKVGHFQIPPISVTIAGQTYTTKPIDIEVTNNTVQAQSQSPGAPSDQNQAPSADNLKDKVLIMVSIDKRDVYLNERIPVVIDLLVNGVTIQDIQYPQFDRTGFTVDDFQRPEQGSQVINGIRYDVAQFKTNIYPNQLGDLSFGPVQIQGNILYKTTQENPMAQDNSFFGADMFNSFFNSYATRPMTATSQPITLHVSPLPDANRPVDFSGAIGQSYDFHASVSPLQVKAGDPLTLKMDITGSGNFKNLKMPDFSAPGFKTYEPQIKNVGDEKTAEEVIIPTSAGIKEVPALHFSYFDTSLKDYKTITQGPFNIQVTAPSPDQEFKAIGFTDVSHAPLVLPANPFSIVKIWDSTEKFFKKLFGSVWFWICLGIILVAGVSYSLWRGFQDRLENDPAFARRFKAVREAKKALVPAGELITAGNSKDFYALLSKVLRDYFANKWHQYSAALSIGEISGHLKSAKIDEEHIAQVKKLLEQADLVCFAGANRDAVQMKADLSQIQNIIAHLERNLK